ncbi:MAG: glycoside hydrolase family 5 protein [Oscillospiraceae bacterium]|nr:glycoside hydrolase family 5 protein [Oscillospiraceae bacterium]
MLKNKLSFFTAVVLSAAMLSGCGNSSSDDAAIETSEAVEETASASVIAPLEGGKATVPTLSVESCELPENDALSFVADMKIGWNLGNTFDATDDSGSVTNDLDLESAWVGVKTTKELIDNIKAAGFNTVRIPVSWHNHVDESFTVNEPFMDRVQEVVDYVINNDMYCIINIHHDNEKEYFYPNSENLESSKIYVEAVWKQICERFADYDEKLIFEGLNEPRLKDTGLEWSVNANNDTSLDSVEAINQLMQTFVDTVRASGGNNSERYLMIPGYAASVDGVLLDQYKLPDDSADNKLIVSVHAYTPYDFALQDLTGTTEWSIDNSGSTQPINSFMDSLYNKFTSQGIPVVIGEFGARNKKENLQARTDFAAYYVAYARARGMTCIWWDNNTFYGSGECFGLFDRSSVTWKYPDIVLAMMEYAE